MFKFQKKRHQVCRYLENKLMQSVSYWIHMCTYMEAQIAKTGFIVFVDNIVHITHIIYKIVHQIEFYKQGDKRTPGL